MIIIISVIVVHFHYCSSHSYSFIAHSYHHHPFPHLPTRILGEWDRGTGTASTVLALQSARHSRPVRTGLAQQTTRHDSGYIPPVALAVARKMGGENGWRKEENHNEDEYQVKWWECDEEVRPRNEGKKGEATGRRMEMSCWLTHRFS